MTSELDRLEQHIHGAVVDGAEAGTFRVHRSIFTFTVPRVLDHHLAVLRRAAQVRPRQGRAAGTRHRAGDDHDPGLLPVGTLSAPDAAADRGHASCVNPSGCSRKGPIG